MKPRAIAGHVPGWAYSISPRRSGTCAFCKRGDMPLLVAGTDTPVAVCEACATLAAWVWRDVEGQGVPGTAYTTDVKFTLVLIVRERPNDMLHPFDVLMVERKDEPGAFGLPGGKVERGETPQEAASRELLEESVLRTWPSALEVVHYGYSPRGSLGAVFLCRAYDGTPEEGIGPEGAEVGWKAWPPGDHARHLAGYYVGVALAFDARWRAQRQASTRAPLSLQLGEPAVMYVDRKLEQMSGVARPDTERMLESFSMVMSVEEKEIAEIVIGNEKRRQSLIATPNRYKETPPAGPGDEAVDEGEGAADEGAEASDGGGEASDDGDGAADEGEGKQTSFGRREYRAPTKGEPP